MPFDDDENPTFAPTQAPKAQEAGASGEGVIEDDIPDYKYFASMFNKKGVSGKLIRKGEKDFESHGTRAQEDTLEASRTALEEVLSYRRIHKPEAWIRAWYFPDWWIRHSPNSKSDDALLHERVVVMEHERGNWMRDIGRAVSGSKDQLGVGRLWLLPEEALYLIERGTVDIWWPDKEFEELLPKVTNGLPTRNAFGPDDYDAGLPLSLEAAYSYFIGYEGERGKTTLPKFQVYTHLKRAGFHVMRAPAEKTSSSACTSAITTKKQEPGYFPLSISNSLWFWLYSMVSSQRQPQHKPFGPLVVPGVYRAYRPIYEQLALVPRHKPLVTSTLASAQEPFRVHYYVWKARGTPFSKKNPPAPDFRIAVTDTAYSSVPTLEQIEALLLSTPSDPPSSSLQGNGKLYQRLKHGYRNVLVAVVDRGLVNFMRFGEAAFGEEHLFERFDNRNGSGRGGKKGGRGGGRGRFRGRGQS